MMTHQALSGATDEAFLQRMVRTYAERFGESFWAFFATHVASRLPPRPVKDYLAWSMAGDEGDPTTSRQRGLRLFPVHNKYTTADWQWLLHEADFAILRCLQLRPTHQMFVALPTGS